MTLKELLNAVKEEHLPLQRVEALRDALIHLRTDYKRRESELKKQRALFMLTYREKNKEYSTTKVAVKYPPLNLCKMMWDATTEGQELLTVQGDLGGLNGEIDSLQSRIYSLIR